MDSETANENKDTCYTMNHGNTIQGGFRESREQKVPDQCFSFVIASAPQHVKYSTPTNKLRYSTFVCLLVSLNTWNEILVLFSIFLSYLNTIRSLLN